MREQTYGWYPSVKDVYKDRRMGAPNQYQLEAMYKFQKSKYYEPPHPPTPRTPNAFHPTPTPPKRPMSTMSSKSRSSAMESALAVRAKSAPIHDFKPIPRLQIPTPHQCWAMAAEETRYDDFEASPTPVPPEWPTPQPPFASPTPSVSLSVKSGEAGLDTRRDRIQSAVIRRERPAPPPRSVKSAGSSRKPPAEVERSTPSRILRPKNPVPVVEREASSQEFMRSQSPDPYEAGLKQYGWRMEVHGDPYKIKPIAKRLTYYVQCPEPMIEDDGPKVHMENGETFFYNTIPRRPATFAIHKEWISETIHAKRMELQKRQGIKHRWKNFAFVY